jgi:hypothetical protein
VGPSDLDDLAKEFATCAAQKYEQPEAQDGTYAGLRDDIELDGAIQQITYSVGPAGATTRASRNSETHPYHPPYNAKRWKEKLSALAKRIGPYTATIRQPDNHINYGGNSMSFVKVGN